jgi:REP element-mobilizing transposase RayT
MVRGIEKRDIFHDDLDRQVFVDRHMTLLVETETRCYAWALMPNHLLLLPTRNTLSQLMRRLLTGNAVTFNRLHDRVGPLFQNRYKSIVCDAETYLLEFVRYIHLNPLRSGLERNLAELAAFSWSGHRVLLGRHDMPGQSVADILSLFGPEWGGARERYLIFLVDGAGLGTRKDLRCVALRPRRPGAEGAGSDEGILGSREFVDSLKEDDLLAEKLGDFWSFAEIIEGVAEFFGLEPAAVRRPGKRRDLTSARGLVCYLAVREMHYRGIDVGRELSLGSAGVSRALRRGEYLIRVHPEVRA